MPLCPTASTPPTVAPPVGQGHALTVLGERGVELGDRGARAAPHRHLRRRDPLDRRPAPAPTRARTGSPPTSHCVRPPTTATGLEPTSRRAADRSQLGESPPCPLHTHAPAGTALQVAAPRPRRAAPCPGWRRRRGRTPRAAGPARRGRRGLNSSGMKSRFSSPMPCSPDSTPPAATRRRDDLVAGGVHPLEHAGLAPVERRATGAGCRRRRGTRSSRSGRARSAIS